MGVSARMCNDLNHLETGPRRVAEAKVGTREQGISARIHVADSHEDRAEDGRTLSTEVRGSTKVGN